MKSASVRDDKLERTEKCVTDRYTEGAAWAGHDGDELAGHEPGTGGAQEHEHRSEVRTGVAQRAAQWRGRRQLVRERCAQAEVGPELLDGRGRRGSGFTIWPSRS
jgi:hypothetical protein